MVEALRPDPAGDSHIQEHVVIVSDPEQVQPAFTGVLRWKIKYQGVAHPSLARLRFVQREPGDTFDLPKNASSIGDAWLGGAEPRVGQQSVGVVILSNASGYDYSDRAHPPNIGIAAVRIPHMDLDGIAERAAEAGIELAASLQTVSIVPYGLAIAAASTSNYYQTMLIEMLQKEADEMWPETEGS